MPGLPKTLSRLGIVALCLLAAIAARGESAREIVNKAILTEDAEEQEKIVSSLAGNPAPEIPELFTAWKESAIYIYSLPKSAAEDAPTERGGDHARRKAGRRRKAAGPAL